jgi:hypothetical protein
MYRSARNRKAVPISRDKLRADLTPNAEFSPELTDLILTFTSPPVLKGIPRVRGDTGLYPVSAVMTTPLTCTITWGEVCCADHVAFPSKDPAIRSSTGGYVLPFTLAIPET